MADGQALKSQRRQQESPVRKRGVFLLGSGQWLAGSALNFFSAGAS
jgi:hypothetical protein